MSTRSRPGQDPGLFDDLPLRPDPSRKSDPKTTAPPAPEGGTKKPGTIAPEPLPLFTEEDATTEPVEEVTRPAWFPSVPLRARLTAGLVDLGVIVAVMLAVWAGLWWLGIELDLVGRSLILIFLIPFSFLYQIFPLAFWGRTPGMAGSGLVARNSDGRALSFSQAALRWMGSLLTVASCGLPLILVATSGRSLADRLSDSETRPAR
jgi:uncharacterized RDD family membrane protein YckC